MQQQQLDLILRSDTFKEVLGGVVAPQVTQLIQPTVKKIESIEESVTEMNTFVHNTQEWQKQQMKD